MNTTPLTIDGTKLTSRLIMGTGGITSLTNLEDALKASGTELTTVAMRRYTPHTGDSLYTILQRSRRCWGGF